MPTRQIIQKTRAQLHALCEQVTAELGPLSETTLTEMLHEAEDIRRRSAGTERLAAEMVGAAAQVVLDERKGV